MSIDVIINEIPHCDVVDSCETRYNSNNHGDRPDDYDIKIRECGFSNFKHLKDYKEFDLPLERWMWKAVRVGTITGNFPEIYSEDLKDYCDRNRNLDDDHFDKPYFIRTEFVSLKSGCHGKKPYDSIKTIVESMLTCRYEHTPFPKNKIDSIRLYLVKPVEIPIDLEFRVFICEGRVTAISQQNVYVKNKTLNRQRAECIGRDIVKFVDRLAIDIGSYVMDVAMIDDVCYFIEINPFGAEYGSGSALFHWIIDRDLLYGKCDGVEFRYSI